MSVILITGASRGLGYELAKKYLCSGKLVVGVSRTKVDIRSNRFFHVSSDVCSPDYPSRLENFLDGMQFQRVEILINNAGCGSFGSTIFHVDPQEVLRQFDLHCVSALRTVLGAKKYVLNTKIVNITSRLGSMQQALRGDFTDRVFSYSYRIAKAAQNMLRLCLMNDIELNGSQILSINPGLLLTSSGSSDAEYTAYQGAQAVIDTIRSASSNGFYHAFGQEYYL